jgi:O-antigen ligase
VKTGYVVTAAAFLLLALERALQARRAWAGRPVAPVVQRTAAAQAVILVGAAIVVGVEATKSATSARPGMAALAMGAVGVVVILAGGLAAVLIAMVGRPRFMIPPQQRARMEARSSSAGRRKRG